MGLARYLFWHMHSLWIYDLQMYFSYALRSILVEEAGRFGSGWTCFLPWYYRYKQLVVCPYFIQNSITRSPPYNNLEKCDTHSCFSTCWGWINLWKCFSDMLMLKKTWSSWMAHWPKHCGTIEKSLKYKDFKLFYLVREFRSHPVSALTLAV